MGMLWVEITEVKLKVFALTIITMGLAACNGIQHGKKTIMHPYHSPQELIAKRQLNNTDGSAKDYVYLWDKNQQNNATQAMYPRSILTQYCHEQGGKFSLLYKSQLNLVRDAAQRKRLSSNRGVMQGIGAYKCNMDDLTDSWIASIEPLSERQMNNSSSSRSVRLLTRLMSANEAKNFYRPSKAAIAEEKAKLSAAPAKAAATAKAANAKVPDAKELARKEQEKKDKELERKELERKELEKKEAEKKEKELKAAVKETSRSPVAETPQQQQLKLYAAARRDIQSGRNMLNACNNAQRAYNYGKLQGAEGTRIYTESGMLVAKCLTSVPVYSSRFPNARGQAKRILNGLASQYNHAGAKNMLRQLK